VPLTVSSIGSGRGTSPGSSLAGLLVASEDFETLPILAAVPYAPV
jgi:hypothetical protein